MREFDPLTVEEPGVPLLEHGADGMAQPCHGLFDLEHEVAWQLR